MKVFSFPVATGPVAEVIVVAESLDSALQKLDELTDAQPWYASHIKKDKVKIMEAPYLFLLESGA